MNTTQNTTDNPLAAGNINQLMIKFAVPSIIAMMVSAVYNIADQLFIGNAVGTLGNAATNIAFPLSMMCTAIALMFGIGGASSFNLHMGAGESQKAPYFLGNSITMLLGLGAILFIGTELFLDPMLKCFGSPDNVLPLAKQYVSITAIGFPFLIITIGGGHLIRADGSPKMTMICNLSGAIINIVLDALFVLVLRWGMVGAALATIISQALSCAWVLNFLTGKKSYLKIRRCNMKLQKNIILPSLALGLSTFIMQASESIISVCFNSSLLKYGGDLAVGAMTILTSAMQFAMLPLQGLGQGAQPIISYNFGAGQTKRVKDSFKLLLKIDLSYSTFMWLLVMLFPAGFASIFTSDQALLTFTAHALRIYMASILLFGIQMACQMTFTSIGNAKASIIVAVTRKFILLLPLIYIMPHIFTADQTSAVYMAEPIADFLAICFTSILFRFEFKKALAR